LSTENGNTYIEVTGMVLRSAPAGEYDRRVVLLTREKGRISAFARGARKPGSPLMAPASPFAFGKFRLYAGKSSYLLLEAAIEEFFQGLRADVETACYASYFTEVSEYVSRENQDGSAQLLLLYQALKALGTPQLSVRLTRCIFEIRTVILPGEYPGLQEDTGLHPAALQALHHIEGTQNKGLFHIALSREALEDLEGWAHGVLRRSLEHEFSSLDILEMMSEQARNS